MVDEIRSLLSVHPLMLGLSDDDLDVVASCGSLVHVPTGEHLYWAGDTLDCIYLIHSGRLALTLRLPNGDEQRLITLGHGGHFGVMAVILGETVSVNAVVEESVSLIRIPEEESQFLANEIPVLRRNFLRAIGKTFTDQFLSTKQ